MLAERSSTSTPFALRGQRHERARCRGSRRRAGRRRRSRARRRASAVNTARGGERGGAARRASASGMPALIPSRSLLDGADQCPRARPGSGVRLRPGQPGSPSREARRGRAARASSSSARRRSGPGSALGLTREAQRPLERVIRAWPGGGAPGRSCHGAERHRADRASSAASTSSDRRERSRRDPVGRRGRRGVSFERRRGGRRDPPPSRGRARAAVGQAPDARCVRPSQPRHARPDERQRDRRDAAAGDARSAEARDRHGDRDELELAARSGAMVSGAPELRAAARDRP